LIGSEQGAASSEQEIAAPPLAARCLLLAVVIALLVLPLHAQIVSTRCATSTVAVPYDPHGARLLGACGEAQPDNVLWNLDRADQVDGALDGEFNRRIDGTGSVIYIIDSGIMASHDEFRMRDGGSKVIAGVDLLADIFGGAMPCDGNWAVNACTDWELGVLIDGHGTAVASAAAGNRVGVAPGAKLVSIRAFGFPALTPARLMAALDAVIEQAWKLQSSRTGIVNLSVGLPRIDAGVETKIREMIGGVDRDGHPDPKGKRFFFTFFGGNANSSHCEDGALVVFPSNRGAAIRGAVAVGGVEWPNRVWSWSCRSEGIEVLAPAADVLVASLTGHDHYRGAYLSSGTSYAAPYVAGIAARMLQQNPGLTPEELEERIEATPARVENAGTGAAGGRLAVFPMEKLERTPTRCATIDVAIGTFAVDKTLVGCGDSFSENVLWHLDRADGITDMTATRRTRGRGAVVYVVDSGVMAGHQEFAGADGSRVIGGLDPALELAPAGTVAGCPPTAPCWTDANLIYYTHGTAVASVIAGRNTGVAPEASIVAVRSGGFALKLGSTETDIFVRALDRIVQHAFAPSTPQFRTAIVNLSSYPLTGSPSSPAWPLFEQIMRRMIDGVDRDGNPDPNGKRFLFVAVAGNTGQCSSSGAVAVYPGILGTQIDGLITVGGIDRANHFWSGSCAGGAIDILAPAENILVASISAVNRYRGKGLGRDYSSGTSYAAPYVAGIAARMLEDEPALTPVELEQRIKASPSFISDAGAPAGGRVAVLIESEPPAASPRRRAVAR